VAFEAIVAAEAAGLDVGGRHLHFQVPEEKDEVGSLGRLAAFHRRSFIGSKVIQQRIRQTN
jgi:hypothetical protein